MGTHSPKWFKPDPRLEQRILVIAELGRLRDHLLDSPELDLQALRALVEAYEAEGCICAAEDLRRRLEWYGGKRWNVERLTSKVGNGR